MVVDQSMDGAVVSLYVCCVWMCFVAVPPPSHTIYAMHKSPHTHMALEIISVLDEIMSCVRYT